MHKNARFNPADYATYQSGYYWGVTSALNVAMLAIERFESIEKWKRELARKKRSA